MKLGRYLLLILMLFISGFIIGSYYGEKRVDDEYQFVFKKLNEIAQSKPDTVYLVDTIRPEPITKWITKEIPVPVSVDPKRNFYSDSLIYDELSIYVQDTIEGKLLSRDVGYKLKVPKEVIHTVTITEEIPVVIDQMKKAEFFIGPSIVYTEKPGLGIGFTYKSPKEALYSMQLGRLNGNGFITLHYGKKFYHPVL